MLLRIPLPKGGIKDMAKRVLVVDDANFMRTIVKDMLAPNGFEIAGEATNGIEAITQYAKLRPDLVTMDITMKVKDGLEAAREILAADPDARIVMVTALGQEKMLMDAIALGVRDFVVKPFTAERILSAVEKALQ
jgi:two-component system chemotaxis response regulator CheY